MCAAAPSPAAQLMSQTWLVRPLLASSAAWLGSPPSRMEAECTASRCATSAPFSGISCTSAATVTVVDTVDTVEIELEKTPSEDSQLWRISPFS